MNKINIKKAQKIIESIKHTSFFIKALTHSSACNENKKLESYETLEFLGDSILNFYTSLFIFQNFSHYSEGKMSKLKQLMVRESTLAYLSEECNLTKYLTLGEGEKKNDGVHKVRILADVFESFIAALYLEKNGIKVQQFLNFTLFIWVKGKENMIWDYKTELQEFCQSKKIKITYLSKEEKSNKEQLPFLVELVLEKRIGNSLKKILHQKRRGKSKKETEQELASKALKEIKNIV